MTRPKPVAVRLGKGPIHLANAVSETRLVAVCGAHFGQASVVPAKAWSAKRARRCLECAEAAAHARSLDVLAIIAGW